MILEAIKIATNNFETGFNTKTLMSWEPRFDKQGRPLNCDPNYKSGEINIEGKKYWFVRRQYNIRLWDKPANYMNYMSDKGDHIEEMDITPDYVKEYHKTLNHD